MKQAFIGDMQDADVYQKEKWGILLIEITMGDA